MAAKSLWQLPRKQVWRGVQTCLAHVLREGVLSNGGGDLLWVVGLWRREPSAVNPFHAATLQRHVLSAHDVAGAVLGLETQWS